MSDDHNWLKLDMDDELSMLAPSQFEALARFHDRERWVWEQVCGMDEEAMEKSGWLIAYHRDAHRNFQELAAAAEQEQEEWEANHSDCGRQPHVQGDEGGCT